MIFKVYFLLRGMISFTLDQFFTLFLPPWHYETFCPITASSGFEISVLTRVLDHFRIVRSSATHISIREYVPVYVQQAATNRMRTLSCLTAS